ncbi:MAG: hypothetical protein HYY28_03645 [Betaproteobacteria bacterium]|nr:hypothetical protein [Betaproteobacteria bacterium]
MAGGNTADGAASNVVESYDPQTNTWSTAASMPTARAQIASGVINNVAYFAGGYAGSSGLSVVESLSLPAITDTTTTTTAAGATTTTSTASTTTTTLTGTVTLNFTPGWNLVGNSANGTLDVAAALGDAAKVTTVWKWVASSAKWAFYTPSLVGQALTDYATSKGYDVLTTIGGGEGFWVNAKEPFTAQLPAGSSVYSASFQGMAPGWNLIAVGDNPTPSGFNRTLSLTPPAAGDIPLNVITLWAWDAAQMNWYFYAPGLEKNGTLASYIASKSYLDFGIRTLDPATGFWVNVPADTSGTTTTSGATTTSTSASTTTTAAATTTTTTAASTTSSTTTSTSTTSATTTTTSTATTTTISAPPCVYAINPAGSDFGADGGSNWFAVTATNSPCLIQEWTPNPSQNWITNVYKYGMSNGNGYVNLTVLANAGAAARNGVVTVVWPANAIGVNHNVNQAGANPFQGAVNGTWGGTCNFDFGPVSVSGTFAMTVDANGGVSGTYLGDESGMITGSVNAGSGGLAATTSGGGYGGISWSGTFNANPLRGNGQWTDSGFCSGTWATN